METLLTLTIELQKPKKIPRDFQTKYPIILQKVADAYDWASLIFFCELLGIIDDDPAPKFETSCYSATDMFGGRSQRWTIESRQSSITREIEKEINESWQHVDVTADTLQISGLPQGIFIDWNGSLGYYQKLSIGNIHNDLIEKILKLAHRLFEEVKSATQSTDNHADIKSDLKRQFLLGDSFSKSTTNASMDLLAEILMDHEEEPAKGALEKLKEYLKENDKIEILEQIFAKALKKSTNKYVRHAIVETAGYTFNKKFSSIILAGLTDEDGYVRECAAQWSKHFWDHKFIKPLIDNAKSRKDENLRWMSVSSLGEIYHSKNLQPTDREMVFLQLMKALTDPFRYVQSAALSIFEKDKDPRLTDVFIRLLKSDDSMIRLHAISILGNLQEEKAISALQELMNQNFISMDEEKKIKAAISKIKRKNSSPQNKP